MRSLYRLPSTAFVRVCAPAPPPRRLGALAGQPAQALQKNLADVAASPRAHPDQRVSGANLFAFPATDRPENCSPARPARRCARPQTSPSSTATPGDLRLEP